jgi:hypothetical protein
MLENDMMMMMISSILSTLFLKDVDTDLELDDQEEDTEQG